MFTEPVGRRVLNARATLKTVSVLCLPTGIEKRQMKAVYDRRCIDLAGYRSKAEKRKVAVQQQVRFPAFAFIDC